MTDGGGRIIYSACLLQLQLVQLRLLLGTRLRFLMSYGYINGLPQDGTGACKVEAACGNMHCQPPGPTSDAGVLSSSGFKVVGHLDNSV